jgi:hypothetical protein
MKYSLSSTVMTLLAPLGLGLGLGLGCQVTTTDAPAAADGGTTPEGDAGSDAATPTGPLSCDEVDRAQEAPALGGETGEVTLSGTYRVEGRVIYDNDQTLVIEPGTVFLMGADSSILIGWRSDPAKVTAMGTADHPVLFCGLEKRAGYWKHVQLLTGTKTDSVLSHVRFEDGGGEGAALESVVDARLDSVGVYDSASHGMRLAGLAKGSENLTVKGSAAHALELHGESAISNLPAGDYTGNAEDVALISGTSNTNVVFHDRGIPYRQTEDRVVYGKAGGPLTSITLEAGVEYQYCQDCFLYVGWRSDPGAIYAKGTAAKPVRFSSWRTPPQAGDWNGLSLLTGTRSDSVIDHVEFSHGGKSGEANLIVSGGSGSVTNSRFAHSAGYGIRVISQGAGFSMGGNTFEENAQGDIIEQ